MAKAVDPEHGIFVVGPPRSGVTALAVGMGAIPKLLALQIPRTEVDPGAPGRDEGDRRPSDERGFARRMGRAVAHVAREVARRDELSQAQTDAAPPRPVLLLEGGALQLRAIARALPEASFVFVYRDPLGALPMISADWSEADGWVGDMVPGWRDLGDLAPAALAVRQWTQVTKLALDDLEAIEPSRWCIVDHGDLLGDARAELERLCRFLEVDPGGDLAGPAALLSQALADRPSARAPVELTRLIGDTSEQAKRAADLLPEAPSGPSTRIDPERDSPFRSVHTDDFAELLEASGSSLLVSTYHAGRLICLRPEGSRVNTHFRSLPRPMGMACGERRLAVGTRSEVVEYRNMPELAPRIDPPDTHDACLVPRLAHTTADVSVHDVAYVGDEAWIVATRFSCLATLDARHSFVPRWMPPFITALAPEDRCHLNGLCVVDERVRWVTALGESDRPGGWREHRADGGLLIDVESGETVLGDLSMPHSPRWHGDRLWLLESGRGELCVVDPARGGRETVAELPGFTRGLAFLGDHAIIGLSKIRETSTFGGLPIAKRLRERLCGVWAVDTRTGEIAGFLRFEDLVQEIYDVVALLGMTRPEIADSGSSATAAGFDLPPSR